MPVMTSLRVARDGRRHLATARLAEIDALAGGGRSARARDERIDAQLREVLHRSGVTSGRVLEIGGRHRPRRHVFGPGFTYRSLEAGPADEPPVEGEVVGDILDCPQLKDETFDVVVSVDVFEHLERPWLAAAQIVRILAPGGLAYTSSRFSGRYDPGPIDYWRFTPPALESLFDDLRTIEAGFDAADRRRDERTKAPADPLPLDALGGWRENVRVFHAAVKPAHPVGTRAFGRRSA